MQKRTQRTTLSRTKGLRVLGAPGRRPTHCRLAAIGAALLIGVWTAARNMIGPGPGESP